MKKNCYTIFRQYLIVGCLLLCWSTDGFSQLAVGGFIRNWQATAPEQSPSNLITRPLSDVKLTTQYMDGFGRPLQTVVKKGSLITDPVTPGSSTNAIDMISAVVFDPFGREANQYLPTPSTATDVTKNDGNFKSTALTQQNAFYTNVSSSVNPIAGQGENTFYTLNKFEASPLNRVMEKYGPGANWAGTAGLSTEASRHGVDTRYGINTPNDVVIRWNVTDAAAEGIFGTYKMNGLYSVGELTKLITEDEVGRQVIEFKDKNGNLVQKKVMRTAARDLGDGSGNHSGWLSTYYMYDALNRLRCVLQPEGTRLFIDVIGGTSLTDAGLLSEHCFRYEYDARNRMIMKKVPGADVVYMVYDLRDRLVMTQDGKQRTNNKWMVTVYDVRNRPVYSGLLLNTYNGNSFDAHRAAAKGSSAYPFGTGNIPAATVWEELTTNYYDNYSWVAAPLSQTYNTSNNYFASVTNSFPYAQANNQTFQVSGLLTGTKTKVLGTSTYLSSVMIYDLYGRIIQVQSQNLSSTSALDIVTTQYTWAGQPLVTVEMQEKGGTSPQTTTLVTTMTYDDLGRNIKVEKKFLNSIVNPSTMSPAITVSTTEYDALGQVKKKRIGSKRDPNATTYPATRVALADQNYDYNIRGWLLGVNRDYLSSAGAVAGTFFGYELGYDKLSNKTGRNFVAAQFNGNIGGLSWKSDGDEMRRKYDFVYDNSNRLLRADFEQNDAGTTWGNATMNFNFKVGDGISVASAYDYNGNIKRLQQWGYKLNAIAQIDDLTYKYYNNDQSNRLQYIVENQNDPQTTLGDFRISTLNAGIKSNTTLDYIYDENGNMVKDMNKDIKTTAGGNGIAYNHLNLPVTINIVADASTNKGTITYTYDANGKKLKKVTVENPTTANGNRTITTTNTYIRSFVYESKATVPADPNSPDYTDRLLFFGQEEGRIRFVPATTSFSYDYFQKDHLGNVRLVLTDEYKVNRYPAATLEGTYNATGTTQTNSMVNHEKKFYNIDPSKITVETAIPSWGTETTANTKLYYNNNGNPPDNVNYPSGCLPIQTDGSTKLYKTNATANKTGLEFVIKVMAGDKFDVFGKSYYLNTTTVSNTNSTALDLLSLMTSLFNVPGSPAAAKGLTAAQLNTLNTGLVPTSFFRGNNSEAATTVPKAYINYILLDEQFKFVSGNASRVGTSGSVKSHWNTDAVLQNVSVDKNGYLFVYVSNESNFDVYFDNLQIEHKAGPMLEETHYYPFGLTMAAISSRAPGGVNNKFEYNGKELQDEEYSDGSGLEWYDYGARTYDPQIARWHRIDDEANNSKNISFSPYCYVANDPIFYIDPDGKDRIERVRTIGKDGTVTISTQVTKGMYRVAFNNTYGGGGYFTKNDYEVFKTRDYRSGKEKLTTTEKVLYENAQEISMFDALKIKITDRDGPLKRLLPQYVVFGSGSEDPGWGDKADPGRPVTIINYKQFMDITDYILLGIDPPERPEADPQKFPEVLIEKVKKEEVEECSDCGAQRKHGKPFDTTGRGVDPSKFHKLPYFKYHK